jgi:phosphate transport system permease protein
MSISTAPPATPPPIAAKPTRRTKYRSSLLAFGLPMVWLNGGALAVCLFMIVGLLVFIFEQGIVSFWPGPVVEITTLDGKKYLGEVSREETFRPEKAAFDALPSAVREQARAIVEEHGGTARRRLLRTGNHELTGTHFTLITDFNTAAETRPEWALVIERYTNDGRFYGFPAAFLVDGQEVTTQPEEVWADFTAYHDGPDAAKAALKVATADGQETIIPVSQIVRAYPANRLTLGGRLAIYLSRWWEFLSAEPRNGNTEGGVWPAILGTSIMTVLMSLAVTPFGVMAALYLREYAKGGVVVSAVRIAVNNLAGVPSIVFGVFGLGFFCLIVGGNVDRLFFSSRPGPTFGTPGMLWASLTLALLTVPVVIVATEEALAAVPLSMREGSYACGASKWQTIWHIVLPRALPGVLTGVILAMARGAGEVAPLMLVGAVKTASGALVDGTFPYLHADRSFLHLGFTIYDVGFQSQNSEAGEPMVFTITMLLIVLITTLNLAAMWVRGRLRRIHAGGQF